MHNRNILFFLVFLLILMSSELHSQIDKFANIGIERKILRELRASGMFTKKDKISAIHEMESNSESGDELKRIADSLEVRESYYKSDFDNNGYTDLLVYVNDENVSDSRCVVLMNFGNDSIVLHPLSLFRSNNSVCKVIENNLIEMHRIAPLPCEDWGYGFSVLKDTLSYKFGSFIELNEHPQKLNIERISCKQWGDGFNATGTEEYIIKLNGEGQAKLSIIKQQPLCLGLDCSELITFDLNPQQVNGLTELINYLPISKMDDCYDDHYSHTVNVEWQFRYGKGLIKNIHDRGMSSSFGFKRLWLLLESFVSEHELAK